MTSAATKMVHLTPRDSWQRVRCAHERRQPRRALASAPCNDGARAISLLVARQTLGLVSLDKRLSPGPRGGLSAASRLGRRRCVVYSPYKVPRPHTRRRGTSSSRTLVDDQALSRNCPLLQSCTSTILRTFARRSGQRSHSYLVSRRDARPSGDRRRPRRRSGKATR
jgi:hypothetical protein